MKYAGVARWATKLSLRCMSSRIFGYSSYLSTCMSAKYSESPLHDVSTWCVVQ